MTTTQTRIAAAAIAALIIAALLVIPDTRSLIIDDLFAPVFGPAFETIGTVITGAGDIISFTFGSLFGEFGEMWSSIFG
jgi:hypothetical protein